jgi:hypothetical protein
VIEAVPGGQVPESESIQMRFFDSIMVMIPFYYLTLGERHPVEYDIKPGVVGISAFKGFSEFFSFFVHLNH